MSMWRSMEGDGPPECDKKYGISKVCFVCDAWGRTGFGIYCDGTNQLLHPGWFTGGGAGEDSVRIDSWMPIPIPPVQRAPAPPPEERGADPIIAAGGCYCAECRFEGRCSIQARLEIGHEVCRKGHPPFCSFGEIAPDILDAPSLGELAGQGAGK